MDCKQLIDVFLKSTPETFESSLRNTFECLNNNVRNEVGQYLLGIYKNPIKNNKNPINAKLLPTSEAIHYYKELIKSTN